MKIRKCQNKGKYALFLEFPSYNSVHDITIVACMFMINGSYDHFHDKYITLLVFRKYSSKKLGKKQLTISSKD